MSLDRVHVYELLELLDRPGPGKVWRGRVLELGGPLEVGTIVFVRSVGAHEAGGELGIDRLLAAHALARKLNTPRVHAPVDHGVLHGPGGRRFWSVSPWISTRPLGTVLSGIDFLPDPLTEIVAQGIAAGLVDLHAVGIFGMGISTDTVLLKDDGTVILGDPGFGSAVSAMWPRDGVAPASMLAAAPESIARAEAVDSRSDLFALGSTLGRCLAGRWHRPDDARVLRESADAMHGMRPSDERPRTSLFLSEVAHTLTQPDRADRIATAAALVSILKERRESAWWKTLHIDQDTVHADGLRPKLVPDVAPPKLPAPTAAPDEEWYAERRREPVPIDEHALPCLGRDREVSTIVEAALGVQREGGRVLFVSGAAGSGKTRIVDAALDVLRSQSGSAVPILMHGSFRRAGIGRPFGAVAEALTRYIAGGRTVDAEDLARLLGEASAIAEPFAAILSSETPAVGAAKLGRDVVAEAAGRCLRAISARGTIVLVVENLQWADAESLDVLIHMMRVARTHPVLVVATHRPAEPGGELDEIVSRHTASGRTLSLHVESLPASEGGRIVACLVEPPAVAQELAAKIRDAVGGLPSVLIETVKLLECEGLLVRNPKGRLEALPALARAVLPRTPAEIVLRRFAALTEDERRFALTASLQGLVFDAEVTRVACAMDHRISMRVLAGLESKGIVAQGAASRRFTSHGLFEAAHHSADGTLLASLHDATAAAFLECRNPMQLPPSQVHGVLSFRVAWHYLQAKRPGRGLLYVPAALDHLRATWRLGDADRLTAAACDALALDPQRATDLADAHLTRAQFLALGGRIAEARDVLDGALRLVREKRDSVREARLLAESARNRLAAGSIPEAQADALLSAHLARAAGDAALELKAALIASQSLVRDGRSAEARAQADCALALAVALSDTSGEAEARQAAGCALEAMGEYDAAEEAHGYALAISRRGRDFARESEALTSIGHLAAMSGDLVRAEGCLRRALAIHSSLGNAHGETRVLGHLAIVLQESGALLDARDAHRLCVERTRRLDSVSGEIVARLNLATAECFLGNCEEARGEYAEALRGARDADAPRLQGYALTGLGEVARQCGQWDVARDLLKKATLQFRRSADPAGLAAALLAAARCETFAGDEERARSMALEAERLAEQQNARQAAAVAGAILALLDARDGRSDDAGRRIAEANVALDDFRAHDATRIELLFLHALILRVLRRPVEGDRKLLQAEAAMSDSLRGLPDDRRELVIANLSPYREIWHGCASARESVSVIDPTKEETVAIR